MDTPPSPLLAALQAHSAEDVGIVGEGDPVSVLRERFNCPDDSPDALLELAVLVLDGNDKGRTPSTAEVAAARDVRAQRCLAWVVDAKAWPDDELRALGFTPVAPALWGYNIADYKPVPDWLNPRHWANPELWDKHRW